MLKRVVHSLGLVENPRGKNKLRGTKASPDFTLRPKDLYVRVVHQGGQQELYQHTFPASKLMAKYPGMCVARAEVFKAPHHSVLRPEERLLLGHKYVIISWKDVEKLKRKHSQQGETKEHNGTLEASITRSPSGHKLKESDKRVVGQEMIGTSTNMSPNKGKILQNSEVKEANGLEEEEVSVEMNVSQGGGGVKQVYCSAKDLDVPKHKPTRYSRRKGIKAKKPFVPPLPKATFYRWQPSLPTIQELSP